jgi:large subunit ribosomal protein L21
MYAIIHTSGHQIKVVEGQEVQIDFQEGLAEGAEIVFDRVLAAGEGALMKFGKPVLAGASVTGTVIGDQKGEKLVVQKFRRRKNSKRKTGHRQTYTAVKINTIKV